MGIFFDPVITHWQVQVNKINQSIRSRFGKGRRGSFLCCKINIKAAQVIGRKNFNLNVWLNNPCHNPCVEHYGGIRRNVHVRKERTTWKVLMI